jgi:cytoskeletal protein RodZ
MLNNYARFLDLDVDALLLQFADALQIKRVEHQVKPEEPSPKLASKPPFKLSLPIRLPASIRRFLSIDIFIGGGLIILLLLFAIWGTGRIIKTRSDSTPQPTAPSISNILISSPESITITPSPTTTGAGIGVFLPAAGETPVLTLPAAGQGAVDVVVIAQDQAWIRVTVDGKVKFEGRVTAGVAYPFDGNSEIEVLTGNGVAISILYNQSNLGPMGNLGEVVDRIYTSKAILEPTATFTPSPTITPTPTVTMRPTSTPRPSSTPRTFSTPRKSSTPNH